MSRLLSHTARVGDTQLELAPEDILMELSKVAGMAIRNALKHREKTRIEEEAKREREELLQRKREAYLFQEAERERMTSPDIDRVVTDHEMNEGEGSSSGGYTPSFSR